MVNGVTGREIHGRSYETNVRDNEDANCEMMQDRYVRQSGRGGGGKGGRVLDKAIILLTSPTCVFVSKQKTDTLQTSFDSCK